MRASYRIVCTAAGFGTPLEALLLTLAMGAPLAGAFLAGAGSVSLVYGHVLLFDCLRCMGYSNVEVISHRAFAAFPPLRYLVYTATYVSHTVAALAAVCVCLSPSLLVVSIESIYFYMMYY